MQMLPPPPCRSVVLMHAISMQGYRIGASVAAGDSAALSMQGCILVTSVAAGDSAAISMQVVFFRTTTLMKYGFPVLKIPGIPS